MPPFTTLPPITQPTPSPLCEIPYNALSAAVNIITDSYQSSAQSILKAAGGDNLMQQSKFGVLFSGSKADQDCKDMVEEDFDPSEIAENFVECVEGITEQETAKLIVIREELNDLVESAGLCDTTVRRINLFYENNIHILMVHE